MSVMPVGCATFPSGAPTGENVAPQRGERNLAIARDFDRQRNQAELHAALACWNRGDTQGCRQGIQRVLARDPNHFDAQLLMVELLLAEDRRQEAAEYLHQAMTDHPENARVQYTMGLLLDSIGQHHQALTYYRQAAQLEPDNELYAVCSEVEDPPGQAYADSCPTPETAHNLGMFAPPPEPIEEMPAAEFDIGEALLSDDDLFCYLTDEIQLATYAETAGSAGASDSAGAVALCGGVDSPALTDFPALAGFTDEVAAAETDKSSEYDDRVDESSPVSGDDLLEKGAEALSTGKPKLALGYFRKAVSHDPNNPQIPILAAVSALRHNHAETAIAVLEPSVGVFAGSAALRRILGTAYYRRGDYKSSQVALQQALSLDKSSALSYFLMGCTLAKLGRSEAAETHFRQAERIDPKYAATR